MTSSGDAGPSGQVGIQHVQEKLHSLLEYLPWSYVALWSFNPQSRSLEWTGGHFTGNSPAQNLQKTCIFTPGQGSVGTAYIEQRNKWMNGPSVHLSAGSEVQAKILEHAGIETAVYIPSAYNVLELGISKSMAEDMHLMNSISGFMWEHILPALEHAQAPPHVSQSPLAPSMSHESHDPLHPDFELNEQTRRMPALIIDEMFMQHPYEAGELGITSSVPTGPMWMPSSTTSRPTDMLQSPNSALPVSAANQQALRFQTYSTPSGTTSSSFSSLEDTSVRPSVDSPPEQSISLMAPPSQRHNSHNYASSSARRETPSYSPELQPVDPTGIPGPPPHLVDAIRHWLGPQEPWPPMYIDPHPVPSAFKTWPHTRALRRREGSTNQRLMRRGFQILRQNRNLQQSNQSVQGAPGRNRESRRLPSSSSPEDMPAHDLPDPAGPSRRPSRTRGPGDEAAKNHMLSERLRRRKQKENFAALRRLVPIISKNDKASILGDAIHYIEDLQADRAELQSRYETLKSSHQELQERNKQLEAMVAATSSGGASSVLPPP